MRKVTRISVALGTSAAMLSLAAIPASADEAEVSGTADYTATIEVAGGGIGIAVGPAVEAGEFIPGKQALVSVPGVAVTDDRATVGGWTVSASLSDFASEVEHSLPIPAAGATYQVEQDTISRTGAGTSTLTADEATFGAENELATVLTVSGIRGVNTAAWNATVRVTVPQDALAGSYVATLTHSVL